MKICYLFPGQGTQKPGMLRELGDELQNAAEVFDTAAAVTGRDVRQLCLTASDAELRLTENTQLAVTAMNLAYFTILKKQGIKPDIVMGHSLGQFSALYAAGVTTMEDTFRIVQKRAELMSQTEQSGALCTVLGLLPEQVAEICRRIDPDGQKLTVALHNTEKQVVVGGTEELVAQAEAACKSEGALRTVPVKVSNAFHTPLMKDMEVQFADFLQSVALHEPTCRIILNCKGDYAASVADIREDIVRQCCNTVHWYDGLLQLLKTPDVVTVEVGIGKTMAGMLRNTEPKLTTYLASNPRQRMQLVQLTR